MANYITLICYIWRNFYWIEPGFDTRQDLPYFFRQRRKKRPGGLGGEVRGKGHPVKLNIQIYSVTQVNFEY